MSKSKRKRRPVSWPLVRRLLSEHVRPYIWVIAFSLVCMSVAAGTTAALAGLMEPLINGMAKQNNTNLLYWGAGIVFVIFATNLTPEDLMDPAFLRRIPYKVRVQRPSPDEYRRVFQKLCDRYGLAYDDAVVSFVMDKIQNVLDQPLAFYQAEFIVDQIVSACKYAGEPPRWDVDLLADALDNISLHEGMVHLDGSDLVTTNGPERAPIPEHDADMTLRSPGPEDRPKV